MFGLGPSFKGSKVKTMLNLAKSRIHLLRNKRANSLKQMRRDIANQLTNGQEASAIIRVEHIMREQNILEAYEIIELFCELIVVRMPIIETQKVCPQDLREAISSIMWASPRCADLPELLQAKHCFAAKYGSDFTLAADELRPGCGVNRLIIKKLSVHAPLPEVKMKLLSEIAKEHNLDWDASNCDKILAGNNEDLLDIEPEPYSSAPPYHAPLQMEPFPYKQGFSASAPPKVQNAQPWADPEDYAAQWDRVQAPAASAQTQERRTEQKAETVRGGVTRVDPPRGDLPQPRNPPVEYYDEGEYPLDGGRGHEDGDYVAPAGAKLDHSFTKAWTRQLEEEKQKKMDAINASAERAKEAAIRAAEAAREAAELVCKDDSFNEGHATVYDYYAPGVKLHPQETYTPDDIVLPSVGGSSRVKDPEYSDADRHLGNTALPGGYPTGSTFDDVVDAKKSPQSGSDEEDGGQCDLQLPDAPTHFGRGSSFGGQSTQSTRYQSGNSDIDELEANFQKLKASQDSRRRDY